MTPVDAKVKNGMLYILFDDGRAVETSIMKMEFNFHHQRGMSGRLDLQIFSTAVAQQQFEDTKQIGSQLAIEGPKE